MLQWLTGSSKKIPIDSNMLFVVQKNQLTKFLSLKEWKTLKA